jgi:hypothetical protein
MDNISEHLLIEVCVVEDFRVTFVRGHLPFNGRAEAHVTFVIET